MFGVKDCRLYQDGSLKATEASVSVKNTLGLKAGDRVQLRSGDWQMRASVVLDSDDSVAPANVDNILVSGWKGMPAAAATCRRISPLAIRVHTLLDSRRAWIGLVLAMLAIAAAYLNAGMQQNGSIVWHLGPAKLAVFLVSAAIALAT